jgi:hypothetical protein
MLKRIKNIVLKHKILAFLVLLNFSLNIIGINFGLPNQWHSDEVTNTAIRMISEKTLNPGRFIYPSIPFYFAFFAILPYAFYLLLSGKIGLIYQSGLFKTKVIADMFLISRVAFALVGGLVIIATYLIAKKISNKRVAILSAAFASINMGIVTQAHFATPNLLVTLFSLLGLFFIVRLYEKPTQINYIAAGIVIGLATGAKYNGIFLVAPLLVAHVMVNKKILINKNIILAGVFTLIAFLLTSPFLILEPSLFLNEMRVILDSRAEFADMYDPLPVFTNIFFLDNGMSTPLLLISFFGIIYSLFLVKKQKKILLLLIWIFLYYGLVSTGHLSFVRYLLPIIPCLIILAALFFDFLFSKSTIKHFSYLLLVFVLLFNLSYVIKADLLFINDSRYAAGEWVNANIPENTKIAYFGSKKYLPDLAKYSDNLYYINLTELNETNKILEKIKEINPEYIIDSSLFYNRYISYTSMYPRNSPIPKILNYTGFNPGLSNFYKGFLAGKTEYVIIKRFPEKEEPTPDVEFINPTILIFRLKSKTNQ